MLTPDDPRLTAYALGELEEAESAEIEAAVEVSPELQAAVEQIRRTGELVQAALAQEPLPALASESQQAIEDEIAAAEQKQVATTAFAGNGETMPATRERAGRVRRLLTYVVAAGIVGVAVTLGIWKHLGDEAPEVAQDDNSRRQSQLAGESASEKLDGNSHGAREGKESESLYVPLFARLEFEFDGLQAPSETNKIRLGVGINSDAGVLGHVVNGGAGHDGSDSAPADRTLGLEKLSYADNTDHSYSATGTPPRTLPSQTRPGSGDAGGQQPGEAGGGQSGGSAGGGGLDSGQQPAADPAAENPFTPVPSTRAEREAARDRVFDEVVEVTEALKAPHGRVLRTEPTGSPNPVARGEAKPGDTAEPGEDVDGATAEDLEFLYEVEKRHSVIQQQIAEVRRLDESYKALEVRRTTETSSQQQEKLDKQLARLEEEKQMVLKKIEQAVKEGDRRQPRSWQRVKAIPNTSRLLVGDREELALEGLQVNVRVDGFRARVILDAYYFNDRDRRLEGAFKLRLPEGASLYYFAFGETTFEYRPRVDQLASNGFLTADLLRAAGTGPEEILKARSTTWGNVKEARLVPREKAAHAYGETVRRRVDPALVEWSGAGVFNARVFPLAPQKLHWIVVGYDVNLVRDGDDLLYTLDLPEALPETMIDLDVSALPGASAEVTPQTRPFTSGGRAFYSFKDPQFEDSEAKTISVRLKQPGVVAIHGEDKGAGQFFATRFTPELPEGEQSPGAPRAIFLVDTSLSSQPDRFNIWLKLLEATLQENRGSLDQFAVLFFGIDNHWWKPGYSENTPENVKEMLAYCHTLSLEGATDLHAALSEATAPSWPEDAQRPKNPDIFLLSDGAATWGELNLHRLAETAKSGSGGTLFAYQTGLAGTDVATLEGLARETGGAVFAVAGEDEIRQVATAHRKRPWRIVSLNVGEAGDLLFAGRPETIYPGQRLTLVGRGEVNENTPIELKVTRGSESRTLTTPINRVVDSELAPRAYGQVAVGQLEDILAAVEDVAVAYARHFRVASQSCSLLILESEEDYRRFDIKPEDDAFVVKSSRVAELIAKKLDELGDRITNPKDAVLAWLSRMEAMPGLSFKTPTALKLALDKLPEEAFAVRIPRLTTKRPDSEHLPKKYFEQLQAESLDYEAVSAEAARRKEQLGPADALRALSSLIERNPGDPVLARDVAFSAIEWNLPGQAYPLLKRVADIRPYEPQTYQALAQCLAKIGEADLAMLYYEVCLAGQWNDRYRDFQQVASVEYLHLLNQIAAGKLQCRATDFAAARRDWLLEKSPVQEADLVVTMLWNTDRTDVDLHVLEPTGEECYYKHRNTRTGGRITRDVTEGFGPEMYTLKSGQNGPYKIFAKYYGEDANRASARTKVYVTTYENYGRRAEQVKRHTVLLSRGQEKRELTTAVVEK